MHLIVLYKHYLFFGKRELIIKDGSPIIVAVVVVNIAIITPSESLNFGDIAA